MNNGRRQIESPDGEHRIVFGSSTQLPELPDNSVDLTVTSPPYFLGADYSGGIRERRRPGEKRPEQPTFREYEQKVRAVTPEQLERPTLSYEDYRRNIASLNPVWSEVWRVTKPGGYVVINAVMGHGMAAAFGEQIMLPFAEDIARWWQENGFLYKAHRIWTSVRNANGAGGDRATFLGSVYLPLEGAIIRDSERVLVFRKPKAEPFYRKAKDGRWEIADEDRKRRRELSRVQTIDEWRKMVQEVFFMPGARKDKADGVEHPAPYPTELAEQAIRLYSCVGDLVLDPFLGTGTTTLAAKQLHRKSIGYEVETRFEPLIIGKTQFYGTAVGTGF